MCEVLRDAIEKVESLEEITLEAVVVLGGGHRWPPKDVGRLSWRGLWARAIQAYHVLMSAIAHSGASISKLSLYKETKICSIPTTEFAGALMLPDPDRESVKHVARHIKHFSTSLATTVTPVRPAKPNINSFCELFDISEGRRLRATDPRVDANGDFENVAALLSAMRNLESLHIHLYQTAEPDRSEVCYKPLLITLLRRASFPRLKSLSLEGFPANQGLLMDIMSTCPQIESLRLRNMFLANGLWDSVLRPAREATGLKHLHLSSLWYYRHDGTFQCLNLEPRKNTVTSRDRHRLYARYSSDLSNAWHTKEYDEEELRRGFDFHPLHAGPMPMANGADYFWRVRLEEDFGPPSKFGFTLDLP